MAAPIVRARACVCISSGPRYSLTSQSSILALIDYNIPMHVMLRLGGVFGRFRSDLSRQGGQKSQSPHLQDLVPGKSCFSKIYISTFSKKHFQKNPLPGKRGFFLTSWSWRAQRFFRHWKRLGGCTRMNCGSVPGSFKNCTNAKTYTSTLENTTKYRSWGRESSLVHTNCPVLTVFPSTLHF